MSRPNEYNFWDRNGLRITRPSDGKLDSGILLDEIPSSDEENWWKEKTYRWVEYLDSLTGSAKIWLLGVDFSLRGGNATMTSTGWNSIQAGNADLVARLPVVPGSRIVAVTLYGREGPTNGDGYSGALGKTNHATGANTQISTTKSSGHTDANTNRGWTTADTDLTPSGYVVTDDPHFIQLTLTNVNAPDDGKSKIYAVSIQLG